jgi:hypothetical protein
MKTCPNSTRGRLTRIVISAALTFGFHSVFATEHQDHPPVNQAGAPVMDELGKHINYGPERLQQVNQRAAIQTAATGSVTPQGFVATDPATQRPFWQHAIFGSGIGASNIIVVPVDTGGPQIIIGGNSRNDFGGDDFWQVIRRNAATRDFDQVFVGPLYTRSDGYPAVITRIAVGNVTGDANAEIVVMLEDGRIYLYDFATKAELGYFDTGIYGLAGLALADLNANGVDELIVTTANDLFVFNGEGNLRWHNLEAGGYDVVVGQMDGDAALEIAATNGKVVDASTHTVQWTRNGGFGSHLKLAPLPGENYQQLVAAEAWQFVYGYDVARQIPLWSINTPQDINAIAVADVDDDGTPEILIGDGQWGGIHVHDLVTHAEKWEVANPEHGVTNIAVANVNNRGAVELLWGAGWSDTGADYLYVAQTTGDHAIIWQSVDLEGPFLGPAIGDLDGDGKKELVVCSAYSNSGYDSGRILVFDAATLVLRRISRPVMNNRAWTGVHDLKLRDLEGDGTMEVLIGADDLYDGAIEIYGFDPTNTFTLKWTNTTQPSGSPFNFVDLADLDGNGTPEVIVGNSVAHTGSEGVYVYIYNYPAGDNPWRSVALATGFSKVTGLVVQDLDANGSKEIAALVSTGDFYTFDGPTRQLRNLRQSTGFTLLSNAATAAGLVGGDTTGLGTFLSYSNNSYSQRFARQLAAGLIDGLNVIGRKLWTGSGGILNVRSAPGFKTVLWQSPFFGTGFGRFVATDTRNGEKRVFSSAQHAVAGFTYTIP